MCLAVAVGAQDLEGYRLVWEDNFDSFDPTKWQHEVTAWGGGVSRLITSFSIHLIFPNYTYLQKKKKMELHKGIAMLHIKD